MLKLSKEIYDRETMLKAAYSLTDEAYFHLDTDQDHYLVEVVPKDKNAKDNMEKQFENILIVQQTRRTISKSTKAIREMIIGRALASTIVDVGDGNLEEDKNFDANEILKDWFEENE